MNILYLTPVGEIGGAEISLLGLIRKLDKEGYRPLVVCFSKGPLPERLEAIGVEATVLPMDRQVLRLSLKGRRRSLLYVVLNMPRLLPPLLKLVVLVRSRRIDMIHTNGIKAHLIGAVVARLTGRRLIWHVRDFIPAGFFRRLFMFMARFCPIKIIVNSNAVGEMFNGEAKLREKVTTIYNGVDLQEFSPVSPISDSEQDQMTARRTIREELGLERTVPLVGIVGVLAPWKGHVQFIEAAARVLRKFPDTRFLIVGDEIYETDGHGGYRERLVEQVERLGLDESVIFTGYRKDIPEIMSALDLVVHASSLPEPFGRVLIEAMAAGKPVVATRAGGVPEVVEDGVTGLLVTPGDVEQLAEAIARLLGEPDKAREMGRMGRERVERLFSAEEHARRVEKIYRAALFSMGRGWASRKGVAG